MIELKQELEALADFEIYEVETATDVIAPLTKEAEQILLEALSSEHRFAENSDPSE